MPHGHPTPPHPTSQHCPHAHQGAVRSTPCSPPFSSRPRHPRISRSRSTSPRSRTRSTRSSWFVRPTLRTPLCSDSPLRAQGCHSDSGFAHTERNFYAQMIYGESFEFGNQSSWHYIYPNCEHALPALPLPLPADLRSARQGTRTPPLPRRAGSNGTAPSTRAPRPPSATTSPRPTTALPRSSSTTPPALARPALPTAASGMRVFS